MFPFTGELFLSIFPHWRGECLQPPLFTPKAQYNPSMTIVMPELTPILSITTSLLAVTWLGMCAIFDIRTRQVPNWLTLPAIPLALVAAWLARENRGETPYEFVFHLVIMTLPLFVAWRYRVLGGADLKILVVLTLANPLLLLAAWIGVVIYFVGLLIAGEWRSRQANQQNSDLPFAHSRPSHFAGVPGFALGAGLFTAGQVALVLVQRLAA
jgi:Flp pilus assembly protein protease CpaA